MNKKTQNNTSEFDRDISINAARVLLTAGWNEGLIMAQESETLWHAVSSLEELDEGEYTNVAIWFYDFIESPDESLDAALKALEAGK